mgnify:CR=1 FL=1
MTFNLNNKTEQSLNNKTEQSLNNKTTYDIKSLLLHDLQNKLTTLFAQKMAQYSIISYNNRMAVDITSHK